MLSDEDILNFAKYANWASALESVPPRIMAAMIRELLRDHEQLRTEVKQLRAVLSRLRDADVMQAEREVEHA